MKLKELVYLLGVKPRPRVYGTVIEEHRLPGEGAIKVARWLHPEAPPAAPSQGAVDFLRRYLRAGDGGLDIGAHVGDSTFPLALAVGPQGLVLAFEPNPYVFAVLQQNATLNPDKTRIIPLPFAAMREDGVYRFQYGEAGYCNGGFHEGMSRWVHGSAFSLEVQGRNLVSLIRGAYPELESRIRIIKVDAEGFDLAILQSLEVLLRTHQPYLIVEMFSLRKSSVQYRVELYGFLVERGYAVHRLIDGQSALGEPVTPDNLHSWNHYDVFCAPSIIPR
jgi:FkbM family methyltransferase